MLNGAPSTVRRAAAACAGAFLGAGATWDVAGVLGWLGRWWPPVSHVLVAAGVAAACVAILVRTLQRRQGVSSGSRATALELLAVGVFLGAWLLRGHPEIPPDPPLVAAQLGALLLLAAVWWRRWRRGRSSPAESRGVRVVSR